MYNLNLENSSSHPKVVSYGAPQGGNSGSQGAQGYIGTQGEIGTQGFIGTQGIEGTRGEQGYIGTQGEIGTQGFIGTIGTQGIIGTQGLQGAQGEPGVSVELLIDDYPTINSSNLVKSTGIAEKIEELAYKISYINTHIIEFQHKDLSLYDIHGYNAILRTTANSYVVKSTGHYVIPLIYGNGITDSSINTAAFTSGGGEYQSDFVNYLGNPIVSPYIETDTGVSAANAKLIWQTSQEMITSIGLIEGSDCNYLRFTVGNIPSTNGDAILAIVDENNNVMWSWMIWVVAQDVATDKLTNHTEVEYEMMKCALGAIYNADRTRYSAPYFQWGRKDPMCPTVSYNSSTAMTLYSIDSSIYTGFGSFGAGDDSLAEKTVANSIKYPNMFFTEYDSTNISWNNLTWYVNFWNAFINSSSVLADDQDTAVKTIYDPCPRGFMVPCGRFATGFTTTGGEVQSASLINFVGSFSNGYSFKRNSEDEVGFYVPALGARNRQTGSSEYLSSVGYWWTCSPYSKSDAHLLYLKEGYVNPVGNGSHARAFPILPVKQSN